MCFCRSGSSKHLSWTEKNNQQACRFIQQSAVEPPRDPGTIAWVSTLLVSKRPSFSSASSSRDSLTPASTGKSGTQWNGVNFMYVLCPSMSPTSCILFRLPCPVLHSEVDTEHVKNMYGNGHRMSERSVNRSRLLDIFDENLRSIDMCVPWCASMLEASEPTKCLILARCTPPVLPPRPFVALGWTPPRAKQRPRLLQPSTPGPKTTCNLWTIGTIRTKCLRVPRIWKL